MTIFKYSYSATFVKYHICLNCQKEQRLLTSDLLTFDLSDRYKDCLWVVSSDMKGPAPDFEQLETLFQQGDHVYDEVNEVRISEFVGGVWRGKCFL